MACATVINGRAAGDESTLAVPCFVCGKHNFSNALGLQRHWTIRSNGKPKSCALLLGADDDAPVRRRFDLRHGNAFNGERPRGPLNNVEWARVLDPSIIPQLPRVRTIESIPHAHRPRIARALAPVWAALSADPHDVAHNNALALFARWVLRRDNVRSSSSRRGRKKKVAAPPVDANAPADNTATRIQRFVDGDWEGLHRDYIAAANSPRGSQRDVAPALRAQEL